MIITLGFTRSDRDGDYSSFCDGYRFGHPGAAPAGPARAIQLALAEQVRGRLRSLSMGDTVTVYGQMLACQSAGWRRVDTQPGEIP